ncbi:MAG: serine/threonine protein kinase [Deltaproteobacteria bacterium]|nr:MAG: serine/threonine protein kinase [Deltaproteobacteria bacterium]
MGVAHPPTGPRLSAARPHPPRRRKTGRDPHPRPLPPHRLPDVARRGPPRGASRRRRPLPPPHVDRVAATPGSSGGGRPVSGLRRWLRKIFVRARTPHASEAEQAGEAPAGGAAVTAPQPGDPGLLERLERALGPTPDVAAARSALRAARNTAFAREALSLLERTAADPKRPAEVALLAAETLLEAEPERAEALLRGLCEDPDTAAEAHILLADHARTAGRLAEALTHYEQALAWRFDAPRARAFADALRQELRPARGDEEAPTLTLPKDRLGPAARRYRLLRELGRGGAGVVYLAEDLHLERRVAVKVLHPGRSRRTAERAAREASLAAAFTHPCIIRIHDVDPERGVVVMEHLAGGSLRKRLRSGEPLPIGEVLRLASGLCEALALVHARGLVHGDLKPANVLLRAGPHGLASPVLADFGIARGVGDPGRLVGTLAYMAPELRAGLDLDARADLYSLGVVLYEALAGHAPFDRSALVSGRIGAPPPLGDRVPPALARLVQDLMRPTRGDRPAEVGEVRRRLAELE